MTPEALRPVSLKRQDNGLKIVWSDAVTTFTEFALLRKACPCASCSDVRDQPPDPFRLLSAREISAGAPLPSSMTARGYYAYQITWNDGHSTGIYPIELLRQLGEVVT